MQKLLCNLTREVCKNSTIAVIIANFVHVCTLCILLLLFLLEEMCITCTFAGIPMRVLLALSVYSNGQKILSTNTTPGTLDCVHGIRFLSMTWVILGHTLYFMINFCSKYQQ